jgi:hypothetical protein
MATLLATTWIPHKIEISKVQLGFVVENTTNMTTNNNAGGDIGGKTPWQEKIKGMGYARTILETRHGMAGEERQRRNRGGRRV